MALHILDYIGFLFIFPALVSLHINPFSPIHFLSKVLIISYSILQQESYVF